MARVFAFCAAMALLVSHSAAAGPFDQGALDGREQAWFYNREGVSIAERDQMLAQCEDFGRAAASNRMIFSGEGLGVDWARYHFRSTVEASVAADITDACMVWNGYRRFDVAEQTQPQLSARIDAMDDDAKAALAGASTPPLGVLGREWTNAYWLGWDGDLEMTTDPAQAGVPPVFLRRADVVRNVRDPSSASLSSGDAIVVVSIRRVGESRTEYTLVFGRVDPASDRAAEALHGAPPRQPFFSIRAPQGRAATPTGPGVGGLAQRYAVFVVPAGTYALYHQAGGGTITEFCLRSIAFHARAGQVLHIGDFTISIDASTLGGPPSRLRVDPGDFARTRAAIHLPPDLDQLLEPATWYNGRVTECNTGPRIALERVDGIEIPGAEPIQSLPTVQ